MRSILRSKIHRATVTEANIDYVGSITIDEDLLDAAGPMAVVLGFVEESPQNRFYNSVLYAEGGRVVHLHRKVYLPTYGLFDEQRYLARGERFRAFDTRFGRFGLLICEVGESERHLIRLPFNVH